MERVHKQDFDLFHVSINGIEIEFLSVTCGFIDT